MGHDKALELADMIRKYWAKLGMIVSVWVVRESEANDETHGMSGYSVRSDLKNGLPAGKLTKDARRLAVPCNIPAVQ